MDENRKRDYIVSRIIQKGNTTLGFSQTMNVDNRLLEVLKVEATKSGIRNKRS